MNDVTVTQEDRDAYNCLMEDEGYDHEPAGAWHFARHRTEALTTARAEAEALAEEVAAEKARHRETLDVLQTAHESEAGLIAKLSARDAALREALDLMRGESDMSLPGSDHWLWAEKVRELIGEGETA